MKSVEILFSEAMVALKKAGKTKKFDEVSKTLPKGASIEAQLHAAEAVLKDAGIVREATPIKKNNGPGDNFSENNPLRPVEEFREGFSAGYVQTNTAVALAEKSNKVLVDGLLRVGSITEAEHRTMTNGKPEGYEKLSESQRKEFDFARLIGISESDAFKVARMTGSNIQEVSPTINPQGNPIADGGQNWPPSLFGNKNTFMNKGSHVMTEFNYAGLVCKHLLAERPQDFITTDADIAAIEQKQAQRRAQLEKTNPPSKLDLRKEYSQLRQRLFDLKQNAHCFEIRCNEAAGKIKLLEQRINDTLKLKTAAAAVDNFRGVRTYEHQVESLERELLDAQEEFDKYKRWSGQAARELRAFNGHERIAELKALLDEPLPEPKK